MKGRQTIMNALTFFKGEVDGGVPLSGGVAGDGLVRARVGRLHARDLEPDEVEHLGLVLGQRHLVPATLDAPLVVVPADVRARLPDEAALEGDLALLHLPDRRPLRERRFASRRDRGFFT